jgi:hypothetical protein
MHIKWLGCLITAVVAIGFCSVARASFVDDGLSRMAVLEKELTELARLNGCRQVIAPFSRTRIPDPSAGAWAVHDSLRIPLEAHFLNETYTLSVASSPTLERGTHRRCMLPGRDRLG